MSDVQGVDVPPNDLEAYADGQLVTEALRQLRALSARTQVFFMAVGLHRPHMDWIVPPSVLAKQPPVDQIELAQHQVVPNDTLASRWAFYNCTELTARARLQAVGAHIEADEALDSHVAQAIRRHYYASVEYMDSQVGRLLNGLDMLGLTNSTAVVFHGADPLVQVLCYSVLALLVRASSLLSQTSLQSQL